MGLVSNQNDFLRSEITKRDEKISSMSRKINAAFVPIEVYSEDKLQFVASELKKRGIQFAEDVTTLPVPEYAKRTAEAILENYQPTKLSIRDRVRLDIDRLVYIASDFDNLIYKLLVCGYDVKHGKNFAVKPPYGDRFIRLKSLGNPYLTYMLDQRILDSRNFTNSIQRKLKTADCVKNELCTTIINITTAVKQFRLVPKKVNPNYIYTFENDVNIDRISRQLATLDEFGLTSREQIYAKADELKADNTAEGTEKLRRIKELIKVYEDIVDGNYIDNLVKSQNAVQKQSHKH